eukprot:TRINITY_DN121529_c0_g1_i1.p1 TRINITY_DN121529_c0_g1~~TRINITY_DN121529_c0_g1_i1.p1  ORF type:complete len:1116 (+),score=193.78 TRINITY_DN121529_c0_g1_i1:86-3433(+)
MLRRSSSACDGDRSRRCLSRASGPSGLRSDGPDSAGYVASAATTEASRRRQFSLGDRDGHHLHLQPVRKLSGGSSLGCSSSARTLLSSCAGERWLHTASQQSFIAANASTGSLLDNKTGGDTSGGDVLSGSSRPSNVRVVVRFRPPVTPEEEDRPVYPAFVVDAADSTVRSANYSQAFLFDRVFDQDATQENVYDEIGRPAVEELLAGYHGTILAYGQTGSGKTYCIFGPSDRHTPDLQGLVPRAARQIFDRISVVQPAPQQSYVVRCSFVELHCEQLRDLLLQTGKQQPLQVKEVPGRGFYVDGLLHKEVTSANEAQQLLRAGLRMRAAANTNLNQHSSRSHAIFTMGLSVCVGGHEREQKLTLVDLAGSEKVNKSGSTGQMLEEAKKINASLSALSNVIDALAEKRPHVPYRDSRLTRLLENSLGGDCRTTLLVTCSPCARQGPETISSLRFAARAKKVCNYVRLNLADGCITSADRQLLHRIAQLQKDLAIAHQDLERRFAGATGLGGGHRPPMSPRGGQRSGLHSPPLSPSRQTRNLLNALSEDPFGAGRMPRSAAGKAAHAASHVVKSLGLEPNFQQHNHLAELPDLPEAIDGQQRPTAGAVRATVAKGASREDTGSEQRPQQQAPPPAPALLSSSLHGSDVAFDGGDHLWRDGRPSFPLVSRLASGNGGSASSSSGSVAVVISHSSASLGLFPSSPSATPLGSWRNLDIDEPAGIGPLLKFQVPPEGGSGLPDLPDQTSWFHRQLFLERSRCLELSREVDRKTRESEDLERQLRQCMPQSPLRSEEVHRASKPSTPHRRHSGGHVSGSTTVPTARLSVYTPAVVALGAPRVMSPPPGRVMSPPPAGAAVGPYAVAATYSGSPVRAASVVRARSLSPARMEVLPPKVVTAWQRPASTTRGGVRAAAALLPTPQAPAQAARSSTDVRGASPLRGGVEIYSPLVSHVAAAAVAAAASAAYSASPAAATSAASSTVAVSTMVVPSQSMAAHVTPSAPTMCASIGQAPLVAPIPRPRSPAMWHNSSAVAAAPAPALQPIMESASPSDQTVREPIPRPPSSQSCEPPSHSLSRPTSSQAGSPVPGDSVGSPGFCRPTGQATLAASRWEATASARR